jgi:hypothetical protein
MIISLRDISKEVTKELIKELFGTAVEVRYEELAGMVSLNERGNIILRRRFGILKYEAELYTYALNGSIVISVIGASVENLSLFGYVKSKTISEIKKRIKDFKCLTMTGDDLIISIPKIRFGNILFSSDQCMIWLEV